MSKASHYLPKFDSSSAMLFSLGYLLNGNEQAVGLPPKLPSILGLMLNSLPMNTREDIYTFAGLIEGLSRKNIDIIESEDISSYAIEQYPSRKYPAVMLGSSNGAATHLCAAMKIPWLPQTVLIAIRRNLGPDDLKKDMEWGKKVGEKILAKNSDMQLNQMHDPVQDRLMVSKMSYFRAKKIKLGKIYENFLKENLIPGGTIYLCECGLSWPVTKISDRHFFQVGGLGDLDPAEYLEGSDRIREFLGLQGSRLKKWDTPKIDQKAPEAEWGFAPGLLEDVERFAEKEGFRVTRIIFDHPEDLSPFVSELYKYWYKERGISSSRLLIECFALLEPLWSIKTGTIPFWLAFNTMRSFRAAQRYLESVEPFEEIFIILLSNAVRGVGIAGIEKWKTLLKRARKTGDFIGLDEKEFPVDLGSFIRYHSDFKHKIRERLDPPAPLVQCELEKFIRDARNSFSVKFIESNNRQAKHDIH